MINEQKIRVLIVDDEPPARSVVRKFLRQERDAEIVGEAGSGRQAIEMIAEHQPDLVLLDIQMPEMNGFEVIRKIGAENMPHIIFVTAYDQYALRAFEVHALDYLLKPFSRARFHAAFQRAREHIHARQPDDIRNKLDRLLHALQVKPKYLQRLAIQGEGRVTFIQCSDIDWIEAAEKYVRLHVRNKSYLLRQSMKSLEQHLDPQLFLRIHRSAIVNLERIKEVQPWFNNQFKVILHDQTELISSKKYRDKLRNLCSNPGLR